MQQQQPCKTVSGEAWFPCGEVSPDIKMLESPQEKNSNCWLVYVLVAHEQVRVRELSNFSLEVVVSHSEGDLQYTWIAEGRGE